MNKGKLSIAALLVVPALMFACNGSNGEPEKSPYEKAKEWVSEHQSSGSLTVEKFISTWDFSETDNDDWDAAASNSQRVFNNIIRYLGSSYFDPSQYFSSLLQTGGSRNKSDSNTDDDGSISASPCISYSDFENSSNYWCQFDEYIIDGENGLTMKRTINHIQDGSDEYDGEIKIITKLNVNCSPFYSRIDFNGVDATLANGPSPIVFTLNGFAKFDLVLAD